ncbi:MAG TPA: signal recognition particle protein [Phycisphaerae bacterium]|nr:signal recognition particle protein [Phycisphaerae bacterium]
MFDTLTERFSDAFRKLRGRGTITDANVREVMGDVRTALLEADVHVRVAREFCDHVLEKAIGTEVIKNLHPDHLMVKIVFDELVKLIGPVDSRIPYVSPPPTLVMLAGLQGSGKTTMCAKLAQYCRRRQKSPMMVAADLKRPGAIDQLEVLGRQIDVPVYAERDHDSPVKVCRNSILQARKAECDVVILDTAGRLAIDEEMMQEVARIAQVTQPHQIYLVLDAMTGQDAVNSAKAFNERLELDGVILTKFDSDTRGGAALSVKQVTGKPIKFIGVGEKLDQIEEFHPDRIASRILGMGDVLTLVEKAQSQFDQKQAAKAQQKMAKGTFGFDDFLTQMEAMKNMGPMKEILKLMPGMGSALKGVQVDDSELQQIRGIIHSMTSGERRNPDLIDASRRRRIARGSGTDPQDVAGLVKQFGQIRGVMKQMAGMGMSQRLSAAKQISEISLLGGSMPKFKTKTLAKQKFRAKKDKRRQRKRKSR